MWQWLLCIVVGFSLGAVSPQLPLDFWFQAIAAAMLCSMLYFSLRRHSEIPAAEDQPLLLKKKLLSDTLFWQNVETLLLDRARQLPVDSVMRVWCINTEEGVDAYSMALLAMHRLERLPIHLKILVTDAFADRLQQVANGEFTTEQLSALPAGMKSKFFVRNQEKLDTAIVRASVREKIRFAPLELAMSSQLQHPFDFIICRALPLHTQINQQQKILATLKSRVSVGGALLLHPMVTIAISAQDWLQVLPGIYKKIRQQKTHSTLTKTITKKATGKNLHLTA